MLGTKGRTIGLTVGAVASGIVTWLCLRAAPQLKDPPTSTAAALERAVEVQQQHSGTAARPDGRIASGATTDSARSPASASLRQQAEHQSRERSPIVAHIPINWAALNALEPIPRAMPNRESDDPEEAGFSPLWAKYSLRDVEVGMPVVVGLDEDRHVLAAPLVSRISATRKRPADDWAYDMEREMRQVIESELSSVPNSVSRVFCNDVGCLFYLEGMTKLIPFKVITSALRSEPFEDHFGIDPSRIFWSGGSPNLPTESRWHLIIYVRDKTVPLERP